MKKIHGILMSLGCAASVALCGSLLAAETEKPVAPGMQTQQAAGAKTSSAARFGSTGTTTGSLAQATPKPQPKTPEEFAELAIQENDKDGDGKISREEFSGPAEAFKTMDANGDGFVTKEELVVGIKKMQEEQQKAQQKANEAAITARIEKQAKSMMEQTDKNKDVKISHDEFITSAEERFKELDLNGDGTVTNEEIVTSLQKSVENSARKISEAQQKTTNTLLSR